MKTKLWRALNLLAVISLLLVFRAGSAVADNTPITGGTFGPNCNSGGYFTPSSATVNSGDTVTISVPSNDPYSGGLEIHGFPQGDFVVPTGGSVTTSTLTADVSYYGTWPSTGCMKGTGTITVNAPVQPPPSGGSGSSAGGSTSPSTPASTPAKSSAKSTTASPTTTTTAPATQPTTTTSTQSDTAKPTTSSQKVAQTSADATSATTSKSPALKTVAAVGGTAVILIGLAAVVAWRLMLRRHLPAPVQQAPIIQPPAAPPNQDQNQNQNGPPSNPPTVKL